MHHTVDAHLCSREALSDFMTWQTISCPALFRSHRENAVVSPENLRVWVRFQNAVVTPVNIRTVCERNRIKDSYRIDNCILQLCECGHMAVLLWVIRCEWHTVWLVEFDCRPNMVHFWMFWMEGNWGDELNKLLLCGISSSLNKLKSLVANLQQVCHNVCIWRNLAYI